MDALMTEPETLTDPALSANPVPTLVIGDIHGHLDRLEKLLFQEGLIERCSWCDGGGYIEPLGSWPGGDCVICEGCGWSRSDKPAEIVLLGDLGHFGQSGSPTGDLMTWEFARVWADVILWGNHDRGCTSATHVFGGYLKPRPEQYASFDKARAVGKLKLAHSSHGYLFTHAGLGAAFRDQKDVPPETKTDPVAFAKWINEVEYPESEPTTAQRGIRDAIGMKRGGNTHHGGILWRDIEEKLYDGYPQVFGHSADHAQHQVRFVAPRFYTRKRSDFDLWNELHGAAPASYCVDIGGPSSVSGAAENCLAGIWLPSEEIVSVQL